MHTMHEAGWSREKNDADNRRTRGSILRAAISNASNGRTSRLWTRAALFEHAVAPEQARAVPVEHSAPPQWIEGHPSSILRFRSRLERHPSSILRLRGRLERPFRASCGSEPGATTETSAGAMFSRKAEVMNAQIASETPEARRKL